jgi:hypothetical protein
MQNREESKVNDNEKPIVFRTLTSIEIAEGMGLPAAQESKPTYDVVFDESCQRLSDNAKERLKDAVRRSLETPNLAISEIFWNSPVCINAPTERPARAERFYGEIELAVAPPYAQDKERIEAVRKAYEEIIGALDWDAIKERIAQKAGVDPAALEWSIDP